MTLTDLRDDDTATDPRDLVMAAAEHALAKKARDLLVIDMRGLVSYTDYWLVCTGQTPRQTKAIAEEVRRKLRDEHSLRPRRIEGDREGEWILLDFLDIIVHVFTPESRDFYRLELLWRRAPQERIEDSATPVEAAARESA